jgi:DNA-binding MarR family transcriptional regulator
MGNMKSATSESGETAPLTISRKEMLVDGSDRTFRRLVDAIFAFGARHEAIREGHAARIGLSGPEYTSLVAIRHLQDDGDVSIKLLADYIRVSGSFTTTLVGKLIDRGLVEKTVDLDDRRRVRLRVTQAGHDLLATLAPVQRQVNDAEFGCLSAEEFRFLLDVLNRLVDSSDQAIALQQYLALEQPYATG